MSSTEKIKLNIAKLPDSPGVYIFKSKKQKAKGKSDILYIGKATSLRDRVRSYFSKDIVVTRGPLIVKMLSEFDTIDHIKTDSVLEALILEAHLIKKYQPEANVMLKDNKSFNFVVITDEDFPRVLIVRGRELLHNKFNKLHHTINSQSQGLGKKAPTWRPSLQVGHSFGPFPNGGQLKEALKLIRKLFPFRDKCIPYFVEDRLPQMAKNKPSLSKGTSRDAELFSKTRSFGKIRACFNRQIGLCPGVCTGEITKEEYARQIKNIVLFFEGKKKDLIKHLEKQMKAFSNSQEFENANKVKRTIFALKHIQDVSLIKDDYTTKSGLDSKDTFRIESYDIAHMSGENVVGVMTVVEDGEINKSEYRKFSA
ncbi:MAG: GIY-YIG nuclease family protein, partial [Minisyncoccia bacterium]